MVKWKWCISFLKCALNICLLKTSCLFALSIEPDKTFSFVPKIGLSAANLWSTTPLFRVSIIGSNLELMDGQNSEQRSLRSTPSRRPPSEYSWNRNFRRFRTSPVSSTSCRSPLILFLSSAATKMNRSPRKFITWRSPPSRASPASTRFPNLWIISS